MWWCLQRPGKGQAFEAKPFIKKALDSKGQQALEAKPAREARGRSGESPGCSGKACKNIPTTTVLLFYYYCTTVLL